MSHGGPPLFNESAVLPRCQGERHSCPTISSVLGDTRDENELLKAIDESRLKGVSQSPSDSAR